MMQQKTNTLMTSTKATLLIRTGLFNKTSLAEELGITRPTLDARFKKESSWKKLEIKWIDYLYKENVLT